MDNKAYILVTHAFPPAGGGGIQRIVHFAKKLKEEGWNPKIYAPKSADSSWVDLDTLNEVKEFEVFRFNRRTTKNLFDKVVNRLIPIDPFLFWSIRVYYKMDKPEGGVIFTSGPPHSVHLVGLLYARFNHGKWVADFRDHFTLGPNYKSRNFIYHWANKLFENQVYKYANRIITNTNTNKEEVLGMLNNKYSDKFFTIYNGYTKPNTEETVDSVGLPGDYYYYLYSGGLRGDHVDGVFYKMIKYVFELEPKLKDRIKIFILGDFSRKGELISKLGLDDNILFHQPVSHDELSGYLNKAFACITWQTDGKRYRGTIATKVFDYIGSQKPIFSIGQPDGEIDKLLKEYKIGLNATPSDTQMAAKQFINFHNNVLNGEYSYKQSNINILKKFDREYQSELLHKLFEQMDK